MSANEQGVTRRFMLKTAAAGVGGVLAGGALALPTGCEGRGAKEKAGGTAAATLKNEDFYDEKGTFLAAKAKEAYFDMMRRFAYPIVPKFKTDAFWALDFGLGDFVHVGMAGIFWWNSKEYDYFGHEIFLLPGQMLVEHAHVETPDAKPKMEAWQVRHGMIYTFGEGDPTEPPPVALPESQKEFITARHAEPLMPGELRELNRPTAKHFMIAGPEGAIVSEYATYHDNAGLRFTNPKAKL